MAYKFDNGNVVADNIQTVTFFCECIVYLLLLFLKKTDNVTENPETMEIIERNFR